MPQQITPLVVEQLDEHTYSTRAVVDHATVIVQTCTKHGEPSFGNQVIIRTSFGPTVFKATPEDLREIAHALLVHQRWLLEEEPF